MSRAEDEWIDCYDASDIPWTHEHNEESYPKIKVIENWFVVEKRYCANCWSIDIGKSKRWYWYCKKICREDKVLPTK